MKINKLNILFASALSVGFTACVNDLNVTPIDPNMSTKNVAYNSPQAYKEGLAKLYACFATTGQQGPAGDQDIQGIDEGFSSYLRQYWSAQELSTDEAIISWNDATIKDFHWQTWSASDQFITAIYYRTIYTATLCNEYIRITSGSDDADIKKYAAEARFIRALAYYHAMDLFGSVPFVTEKDLPGAFLPKQILRADLYNYIESELLAIESEMGAPKFEYGRADQGACWMLLAKLYSNAKVYTGQEHYTEALTYLNKVIATPAYSLAVNYRDNFCADNELSPEVIFPITFDGDYTRTWGGTTFLVHAPIASADGAAFGVNSGWGGIRTTAPVVDKFPDVTGTIDSRALFLTAGRTKAISDVATYTDGYALAKFTNLTHDGQAAKHHNDNFVDTDFPMFRLADAYLMYAEAVLRSGTGGTRAQALSYVNALRERAYGSTSGDILDSELTLNFILDERARELYHEGHRRTDLIRYEMFTGDSYLWPWKGNVAAGTGTDSYRDLYPIPASDLAANPTLKQNDGYNN